MTKQKRNVRTFRQGYEEVYQLGYQTADLMVTDSAEFAKYGIDHTAQENLTALLERLKFRSIDEIELLGQKLATESKDMEVENFRLFLIGVENRLYTHFGANSPFYKMFELSSISTLEAMQLVEKARLAYAIMQGRYKDEFGAIFTLEQVAELTAKADAVHQKVNEKVVATAERRAATDMRYETANQAYSEIKRIRRIGKQMWAYTDYEKSRRYTMPSYHSQSNDAPEVLSSQVVEGETYNFSETNDSDS
jgi:hypothetical protein